MNFNTEWLTNYYMSNDAYLKINSSPTEFSLFTPHLFNAYMEFLHSFLNDHKPYREIWLKQEKIDFAIQKRTRKWIMENLMSNYYFSNGIMHSRASWQ